MNALWDDETADAYDTPGVGMFAPATLEATTERLAELAGGGRALEFAIGTGRVAVPLAARGVPVSGIELSTAMLRRLREKAGGATIPVVPGDMATTRAPGEFTLVYLVYNTIGNLLTQDEQVECFRNAARHLTRGGRFVIELFVPSTTSMIFTNEPGYLGVDTVDPVNQHLVSHHFRFDPQVGGSRQARLGRTPQRYIWPAELDLMARIAGFTLESRHADWSGTDFTATSPSHVSVYRLP
jgi:SAM-dependent methyltransferase